LIATDRHSASVRILDRDMDEPVLPRPMVRCLTKLEAAQYLGIGVTTFDALRIPAVRFGRRCLYDRIDLDTWLDDYKQQGRAGKETQWPVKPGSTDVAIPVTGGLQQRYRTASAYAKVLGLKTEEKQKRSSPS
jgi:excisionase family DNA binding protein